MRLEYVVIGFILMLVVLIVALSMLNGVIPGVDTVLKLFEGR